MMRQDTSRDLQNASVWNIARRGLDEEEWLLWYGVVEFFGMGRVVSANSYDLSRPSIVTKNRKIRLALRPTERYQDILAKTLWKRKIKDKLGCGGRTRF